MEAYGDINLHGTNYLPQVYTILLRWDNMSTIIIHLYTSMPQSVDWKCELDQLLKTIKNQPWSKQSKEDDEFCEYILPAMKLE